MVKNLLVFAAWLIISIVGFALVGWYGFMIEVIYLLDKGSAAYYIATALMAGMPFWIGVIIHRNVDPNSIIPDSNQN